MMTTIMKTLLRIVNKPLNTMVKHPAFTLFLTISLSLFSLHAQEEGITNRSNSIQYIDGKEYYLHAVLQGQTLYSIARAYGVPVEAIMHENPDLEDGLRYDQIIRIPVLKQREETPREIKSHAPRPEGEYAEHEVTPRETLFGLSQHYGVPIETILYYNPAARGGLKIGQLLRIPLSKDHKENKTAPDTHVLQPQPGDATGELPDDETDRHITGFFYYSVAPGDTKYGISRRAGISIEQLEEINPEIKEGLQAGQDIKLPILADQADRIEDTAEELSITVDRKLRSEITGALFSDCLEPVLKEEYHVALLIPFYLEELIKEAERLPADRLVKDPLHLSESLDANELSLAELEHSWPEGLSPNHKSFTFISFYQGVLLALDSINSEGVDIKLHVHDVCRDFHKARKITSLAGFDKMDLIIGPFHRQSLNHIAAFGRRHGIPVVSPLLPDNHQLRGSPNLFKTSPSLETMLKGLAGYIAKNYPRENIIIVHNQQAGAADIISTFNDKLLAEVAMMNHYYDSMNLARVNGFFFDQTLVGSRQTNVLIMPDTVTSVVQVSPVGDRHVNLPKPYNVQEVIYRKEGLDGLLKHLRKDRENVLITLISGEPFLSDYLRQLHTLRHDYDISIFGIPEWQDYASIEIDYLQNLKVHIFVPVFIDYNDRHIRDFVLRFREIYQTEPDEEAIKAAQTAFFFFEALALYGNDFWKCIPLLNNKDFETPFSFIRPMGEENGWENRHFHIYRIKNYQKVDVQRPVQISQSDRTR